METIKILIVKISESEAFILSQDGGNAYIHHNGENFITTYQSFRLGKNSNSDEYDSLCENDLNAELFDWNNEIKHITSEMYMNAISWLHFNKIFTPEITFINQENFDYFQWLNENYLVI